MKRRFLVFSVLFSGCVMCVVPMWVHAQKKKKKSPKEQSVHLEPWQVDTLMAPIPISRQLFAENIDKQLKIADLRDGEKDGAIDAEDKQVSKMVTDALLHDAALIKIHIENLPNASSQAKIGYHRALEAMLRKLNAKPLTPENATYTRRLVENFNDLMVAVATGKADGFAHENANIYTLDNSELLAGYPKAKAYVFETVGLEKPAVMIKRLPEFARESYADPVIAAAARIVPGTILTYATSTSYLSAAVRRNKDPLVQTIVRIGTESKTPLKALPFLNDVHNKKRTIREIDAITANPKAYFKALVQLKTAGDTLGGKAIDEELDLRGLEFVREANRLHDSPAPVRFKSLTDFGAEDLYFMMIGSQDEIYTSSFVWMFNRMLEQMKGESGAALLDKVHKSHFRTFIRMAAGYNTLSPFLATMDEGQKTALMKDFVTGLELGPEDDLEDAVDVADAFGSISDPELISFLKEEIKSNYERTYKANDADSEKGVIVYGLLSTIFNSADNANRLSGELSVIPPVTYVPYQSLVNGKGEVIVHTFFYGDEDGRMSFNSFKTNFSPSKWKMAQNKDWVTFTAAGKNPVTVYANLPLTEPKDEEAQKALQAYLEKNDIVPTMVIHRGHSYHLSGSLANLTPDVKIVMLGSCGGYHNLAQVLDKSPDANIISSKQTGSMSVNEPIIRSMFEQILEGKDINWIDTWNGLGGYFGKRSATEKDLFSDYVPPNKNLGAIFIKAYRKMALNAEG
ncbi:MAG: hypothetical protein QM642_11970 [Edaphocola sp.]